MVVKNLKVFETERLSLRALSIEDLRADPHPLYDHPDVVRDFGKVTRTLDRPWNLTFVQEAPEGSRIRISASQGFGSWSIYEKTNKAVIGHAYLGLPYRAFWIILPDEIDIPYVSFEVDLVCVLAPDCWGKGYGTEVGRPIIDYAFSELRLKRLVNYLPCGNFRGQRLLRRLGFRLEANQHPNFEGFACVLDNTLASGKL